MAVMDQSNQNGRQTNDNRMITCRKHDSNQKFKKSPFANIQNWFKEFHTIQYLTNELWIITFYSNRRERRTQTRLKKRMAEEPMLRSCSQLLVFIDPMAKTRCQFFPISLVNWLRRIRFPFLYTYKDWRSIFEI